MPATAERYGLRVRWDVDERLNPVLATRAAARYLRDLHYEFGTGSLRSPRGEEVRWDTAIHDKEALMLMVRKTTDAHPAAELRTHVKSFKRPGLPGSNAGAT